MNTVSIAGPDTFGGTVLTQLCLLAGRHSVGLSSLFPLQRYISRHIGGVSAEEWSLGSHNRDSASDEEFIRVLLQACRDRTRDLQRSANSDGIALIDEDDIMLESRCIARIADTPSISFESAIEKFREIMDSFKSEYPDGFYSPDIRILIRWDCDIESSVSIAYAHDSEARITSEENKRHVTLLQTWLRHREDEGAFAEVIFAPCTGEPEIALHNVVCEVLSRKLAELRDQDSSPVNHHQTILPNSSQRPFPHIRNIWKFWKTRPASDEITAPIFKLRPIWNSIFCVAFGGDNRHEMMEALHKNAPKWKLATTARFQMDHLLKMASTFRTPDNIDILPPRSQALTFVAELDRVAQLHSQERLRVVLVEVTDNHFDLLRELQQIMGSETGRFLLVHTSAILKESRQPPADVNAMMHRPGMEPTIRGLANFVVYDEDSFKAVLPEIRRKVFSLCRRNTV